MWLSYPHWQRCIKSKTVLQFCFSGILRSTYGIAFWDQEGTVLSEVEVVSSLNFVRSWFSRGVSGRTLQLISGMLRPCESTDLQVSRLQDAGRCHPWDQLLKKGLSETQNVCELSCYPVRQRKLL